MAEERQRRKALTPLESELRQAPAEWTPPGPVAKEQRARPRPEKRAPTTTGGMLVQGTKRFLFIVGALAAAAVVVSGLIEYSTGAAPGSVFPVVFYVAGAIVMSGGTFMALEGPGWVDYEHGIDHEEKEGWITNALAPVSFGLTLIGIGVALEAFLF